MGDGEDDHVEVGPRDGWRASFAVLHFRVRRSEWETDDAVELPRRAVGDSGPTQAMVRLRWLVPPGDAPPPFAALVLALEFGAVGVLCDDDEDHDFLGDHWDAREDGPERIRAYVPVGEADAFAAAWRLLEPEPR